MIDAAILTTLIPGSVWARARKDADPSQSTVLCVTNQSLSARVQEEHPPQVIFVTEAGKICSQEVEHFLKRRTYVTTNNEVDQLMTSVIDSVLLPEEDEADPEQFESIDLDASDSAPKEDPEAMQAEEGSIITNSPFQYNGDGEIAEKLADCFSRYSEVSVGGDIFLASLTFMLDDMSVEELESHFQGNIGFSITYQIGATEVNTHVPAGTWELQPTQLEIGSSGNAYARLALMLKADVANGVLEQVDTEQVTEAPVTVAVGVDTTPITVAGLTVPVAPV